MSVWKGSLGLSLTAALLLLSSCTQTQEVRAASAKPESERKAAPDFKLKDADGQTVSLSDYRGKVVLLNFWATWCGPCALEIPWFEEFEQQYKSHGFEVLGVSMDDDGWSAVKPYIAAHKMNYRILLGNDSVAQLYGGLDALPTTFILDREGRIAFTPHVGLVNKDDYLSEIQELLGLKRTNASLFRVRPPLAALFPRPAE
ncbi:MAG: TlpA family protein disulfide reductase [Acidobacteriaceae bacterium]|nr:TlpA family protein disulfide reductase [Acidobacteriaceae bacterium]MBV9500501.1 TlpA family protein disulfide reductase [Acidobacteriaceae bacterium]